MADRRVSVQVDADVSPFVRRLTEAGTAAKGFARELESADSRFSGLVQTSMALAPALVPIGAAAVPAIAGLTEQLGFAVAAGGVAVLAFQGIGDALDSLNKYQLDPTDANLKKLQETFGTIGPAGQEFVLALQSMRPELKRLEDAARSGMFPGLTDSLQALSTLGPEAEQIIGHIATAMGDLARSAGTDLASPRWRSFFQWLDREAAPTLTAMGQTLGNVVHGLAQMVMAFSPLADSFTQGMVKMSAAFDKWATGLASTQGFQEFVDYVRSSGPEAMDALASLAKALVSLVEAAAPVGHVVLPVIARLADAFASLAQSPVGPLLLSTAAAVGVLGRSLAVLKAMGLRGDQGLIGRVIGVDRIKSAVPTLNEVGTYFTRMGQSSKYASEETLKARESVRGFGRAVAPAALAMGGLALATSGVADKMGLAHTATYGMMGALAGPWGAAVGAAVGLTVDLWHSNDHLRDAIKGATEAMRTDSIDAMRASIVRLRDELDQVDNPSNFLDALMTPSGASEQLRSQILDVEHTIRGLQNASGDIATIFGSTLAPQLGSTADAFHVAALSADDFRNSLDRVNATLEGRANFRDYQAALDDFTKSVKENGKAWHNMNEAGRANNAALDQIASTALKVAENLKGMNRLNFLDKARGQFVEAATEMGMARKKANELADSLGLLDKKDPTVNVKEKGADEAKSKVDKVKGATDKLPRNPIDILVDAQTGAAESKLAHLAAWHIPDKSFHVTAVYGTAGSTYNTRPSAGAGRFATDQPAAQSYLAGEAEPEAEQLEEVAA